MNRWMAVEEENEIRLHIELILIRRYLERIDEEEINIKRLLLKNIIFKRPLEIKCVTNFILILLV